jgi:hypothetical protein
MTTSLMLTLDRLRDGHYRFGITPPAASDEGSSTGPSMFEAETLDEAMSGLGDRLIAFFLPRTEDDADLGPFLNWGTSAVSRVMLCNPP